MSEDWANGVPDLVFWYDPIYGNVYEQWNKDRFIPLDPGVNGLPSDFEPPYYWIKLVPEVRR